MREKQQNPMNKATKLAKEAQHHLARYHSGESKDEMSLRRAQEAFTGVIEFTAPALISTAIMLTRDNMRADDLLQETSKKAWERLPQFKGNSQINTWMYRVMKNIFFDQQAKIKARKEVLADNEYFDEAFTSNMANPEEQLLVKDKLAKLSELSPVQQEVLFRYGIGLSYEEIGEEINIPEGTAKSHAHRGRAKLSEPEIEEAA